MLKNLIFPLTFAKGLEEAEARRELPQKLCLVMGES